jgi:hypothetical protein
LTLRLILILLVLLRKTNNIKIVQSKVLRTLDSRIKKCVAFLNCTIWFEKKQSFFRIQITRILIK